MKRVKIMLIAIIVFATIAGALAFNAHKKIMKEFCYTTTSTPGKCTIKTFTALGADGNETIFTTITIVDQNGRKTCPENPECYATFTILE